MKNLKKVLASLVVVAMMASMAIMPAFAETFNYQAEAEKLYAVGLYKGISTDPNNPDLDLATLLDRQTGVVMLLRLFGQEEEAKLLSDEQANSLLAKFSDAGTIADWAKRQVAYAVEKGFVKGYEDSTFRPTAGLNGKAYASLLLQQLGYDGDFDYHQAAIKLSQVGGLTASQATTFNSDAQLNKDALVGISYGALQAKFKADGKKVIKALIESKYVDEEKVKEAGIPYADIVSVAEIADVTVDIGGTPTLPATVTATYDNGTTAEVAVTWPTVDTSAAGEFEITGTIADTDVTAKVKVIVMPAELRVSGSTSGNRKEIILNFNRPVGDADKAKDKASYKVKKHTVANAELSEDQMTVTLLVDGLIANQSDVEVTVKKDVGLKEDATVTIENVKDVSTPEVASVEAIGNSLVRVTFTEPVQNARTVSNYTIDGKSFAASNISIASNEKVVSIVLKNALSDGEHKLVVKNKVTDYVGFAIEDNETTFSVVEDKEAPTGEVESATQTKVVIKFSEPVKEPDEDDVYTNTKAEIEKLELSDDGTTYTITFSLDDPLPASGGKITIDNLSDYSGNKTDFVVTVKPDYDDENPEIVGYEIKDDQKKIVIEYSEDVFEDSGDYELLDANGDEVSIDFGYENEDTKNKIAIVRTDSEEFASGKYKLTVKGVEDYTPMRNQLEKTTLTIEIDDEKAPVIARLYKYDSNETDNYKNILFVRFNEDVDEDSVTDLDNYTVELAGNEVVDLDNDNVEDIELLSDERTVAITFNDEEIEVDDIVRLTVENVKDIAGNEAKRLIIFVEEEGTISIIEKAPAVESAAVTGSNTIVVKLDGDINGKTLSPDDFIVEYVKDSKTYTLDAYDAEYDQDKSEVKLFFSKEFGTDGTFEGNALTLKLQSVNKIDTTDVFDQKLVLPEEVVEIPVDDKFNPSISSIAKASRKVVDGGDDIVYAEIEVSEELDMYDGLTVADEEGLGIYEGESAYKLNDDIASQFYVLIGSERVDVEVYYVPGADEDNKDTKDIDETKARLVLKVTGDYSKKTISVDYNPVADTETNRESGKVLIDNSGNALGAKKGMSKSIVLLH